MKTITNITKLNFLFPPRHRNSMRTSEMEGERPLGDQRPALAIVCLLLVGTTAVAAPTTSPIPTPTMTQKPCVAALGETSPNPSSSVTISTNLHSIPPIREIETNGIPNHCVKCGQYYNTMRADQKYRDDRLILSNSELGNMHAILSIKAGDNIQLKHLPEDVVIVPDDFPLPAPIPTQHHSRKFMLSKQK